MSNITEGREYISEWVSVMNSGITRYRGFMRRGLALDMDVFVEGQKGPVTSYAARAGRWGLSRVIDRLGYDPLRDTLAIRTYLHDHTSDSLSTTINIQKFSRRVTPQMLDGHSWDEEYRFLNARCSTDNGFIENIVGEGKHFFVNIRIFH